MQCLVTTIYVYLQLQPARYLWLPWELCHHKHPHSTWILSLSPVISLVSSHNSVSLGACGTQAPFHIAWIQTYFVVMSLVSLNLNRWCFIYVWQVGGFVCWLVGCLISQQHASVSQGWICSENFTQNRSCRPNFPSQTVTVYSH